MTTSQWKCTKKASWIVALIQEYRGNPSMAKKTLHGRKPYESGNFSWYQPWILIDRLYKKESGTKWVKNVENEFNESMVKYWATFQVKDMCRWTQI